MSFLFRKFTNTKFSLLLLINTIWQISFTSTAIFVSAYIFKISGELSTVAIFYLTVFVTIPLVMLFIARSSKAGKNIFYIQCAIWLQFVFFFLLYYIGERAVNHVVPLGALLGASWGFYYLPYADFILNLKTPSRRVKFLSFEKSLTRIVAIIAPILIGYSISLVNSYAPYFIFVSFTCLISCYLSFFLKEGKTQETSFSYDFNKIWSLVKNKKNVRKVLYASMLTGMSCPIGYIIYLVIFNQLGSEFSLGFLASLLPIVAIFTSLAVSKVDKNKHGDLIIYTALLTAIVLSTLSICHLTWQIILMIFVYRALVPVFNIIYQCYYMDMKEEYSEIADYRTEYLLMKEVALFIGRAISFSAVILIDLMFKTGFVWGVILTTLSFTLIAVAYVLSSIPNDTEENFAGELQAA